MSNGRFFESVTFPCLITEMPEGTYKATAQHHNDELSRTVIITAGATNPVAVNFAYGAAVVETEPPGAVVRTVDGRFLGATPLQLAELKPGSLTVVLQRNGYAEATATLAIVTDQTTPFHTNLVSANYLESMKAAQQAMNQENYAGAFKAVGDAIMAKPDDVEARALRRNATGLASLQRARKLGTQGDFMGGEKELATTLEIFPDNAEAQALLAEFKQREPEQKEKMRLERLGRGSNAFANALLLHRDADLFTSHEFKTTKPVDQVRTAILNALKLPPELPITKSFSPAPETYEIEYTQEFSTYLATSAGNRVGVIVCAQTQDDET